MMLVDLKNRMQELNTINDTTPSHQAKFQSMYGMLNPLKTIPFKSEFFEVSKGVFDNLGKECDEKYETLYDFVNVNSFEELSVKSKEAYNSFIGSMESLEYSFNYLIHTIENIFEAIFKTNHQIDSEFKEIEKHKEYITKIAQSIFETKQTKAKSVKGIAEFCRQAEDCYSSVSAQVKEYVKLSSIKKKNYGNLITNAPVVKEKLQKLEQDMDGFEGAYSKLKGIYTQCDSLGECYSKFGPSYGEFLLEINRRKDFEKEIECELGKYRKRLYEVYEKEYNIRMEFRSKHLKNLPSLIAPIAKENPIRYEIYPLKNWSLLSKLSYNK